MNQVGLGSQEKVHVSQEKVEGSSEQERKLYLLSLVGDLKRYF